MPAKAEYRECDGFAGSILRTVTGEGAITQVTIATMMHPKREHVVPIRDLASP